MPASCDPSQDRNEILALRSPRSGGGSASEVQAQRIPVPFVGLDGTGIGRDVAARSVAGRGIGQGRLFGSPASRVVSAARLPLLTVDAGDCRGEVPGHESVDARRGVHVDDPAQGGGRLVALPMRRLPFSLHEVPKRRNLARRCGGLCRRNEIVRLRWSEVDGDRVLFVDSKTGPRTIPLGSRARAIIAEWRAQNERIGASRPTRRIAPRPDWHRWLFSLAVVPCTALR